MLNAKSSSPSPVVARRRLKFDSYAAAAAAAAGSMSRCGTIPDACGTIPIATRRRRGATVGAATVVEPQKASSPSSPKKPVTGFEFDDADPTFDENFFSQTILEYEERNKKENPKV